MATFTPAVIFLMIANTIAASAALFATWQISSFEVGRNQQLEDNRSEEDAAAQAGRVQDRAFGKAA
jgi:hypothetical protein